MFGSDLLGIQQEIRNNKNEAKRVEEEEKRKKVIEYLGRIKMDLETVVRNGYIPWKEYKLTEEQELNYELLRKLGCEEGISICKTTRNSICAEVKRISIYDTYESLLKCYMELGENIKQYLGSEYVYAIRIKDGTNALKIWEEIARKDESDQKNAMLALANALYKNGLEGYTPELGGVLFKIQSTLKQVLGSHCTEKLENHTEILHRIYKEEAKNHVKKP